MAGSEEQPLVIVGGGLAGALLALMLRHRGSQAVTLVETAPLSQPVQKPDTPSFDARSTALSAGTLAVLDELGLGDPVRQQGAAIETVHVSRRGRLGLTRLRAAEEGLSALGTVVENRALGHVLLQALFADPAIRVQAPARLAGIARLAHGYRATLESGEQIDTPLLIAADGANSRTREWLGVSARQDDTGHDALITNLGMDTPHRGVAYERFLDEGPMALLPLPDDRMALIWTGPRDSVAEWLQADPAALLAKLRADGPATAPRPVRLGQRHCYPLVLTQACAQAVPHAVVVGNAAHTLHPVAGQGFNLTVRDLDLLSRRVGGASSPGDLALLKAYVADRQQDQALIGQVSRWVPEMFRVRQPLFAHSRQLGLVALDLLPGLRSQFSRRAMGL